MDLSSWMQRPEMARELAAANGGIAAQKQFIMFDKTGDRGRILFSPTRFYEFPTQPGHGEPGDGVANFQNVYQEAVASFAELQSLRERSRPFSITLFDINSDADCSSKLSWGAHQGSPSSPDDDVEEEDSDDIDALLESDDEEDEECSTGHSPSDVTNEEGDEEIESRAPAKPAPERKLGVKRLGGKKTHPMKKKRKEKIKNTVKVLQSLIPGGESLDVAVVLDEAIRYMKTLQMKVVQLETSRQVKF